MHEMIWLLLGGGLVAVVVTVWLFLRRVGPGATFTMRYKEILRKTKDPGVTIALVLEAYRARHPFAELTDDDIEFLAVQFSGLKDPTHITPMISEAVKMGSVHRLRDRQVVSNYIRFVTQREHGRQ